MNINLNRMEMKLSKRKKAHNERNIMAGMNVYSDYMKRITANWIRLHRPKPKRLNIHKARAIALGIIHRHNTSEFFGGRCCTMKGGVTVDFGLNDRKGKISIR